MMKVERDLTLTLEADEVGKINLPNYRLIDSADPTRLELDFVKCKHLNLLQHTATCGKFSARYRCLVTRETTTPDVCRACKIRVEPTTL